jgi:protocatechuate 3,4-dioxygenase beta subunit
MRLIRFLALSLVLPSAAAAQGPRQAPTDAPSQSAMADSIEAGTRLTVSGRVIGNGGRPIAGASLYVYQTDANGEYVRGASGGSERPRLFTYLRSDSRGRYSFSTIRPGSYPNSRNPGHIHFEVVATGHDPRIYEIVFEGDPLIPAAFRNQARDAFGGVAIVTARPVPAGGLAVEHDVRLRPR